MEAFLATAPATFSSPSPLPTKGFPTRSMSSTCRCFPTKNLSRSSLPRSRPPKKPSSTPWSPPKPLPVSKITRLSRCRTINCAPYSKNTIAWSNEVEPVISLRSGGRLLRRAVLFFSACVSFCACSPSAQQVLAIAHVTVIDMTRAAPRADQTIIIKNDRITEIGASNIVMIPPGAHVVDGRGKFLIPGLVDMHVHLTGAGEPDGSRKFMLPLMLANGVTSVRDMGGYLESLIPLRKEIEEGKRLGPRIITPGPYLDGSPPSFQPSLVVTNSMEADEDVHQLASRAVDFIKVQSMLSRDAYVAIAKAAQREHIVFVGHVPDGVTAAEAADVGQHSIEHLTNVLRGCSRDEPKLMREQLYIPLKQETPEQSHSRIVQWQHEL